MAQRKTLVEPTSLRRSPRFLSPITPQPTSKHPLSFSSLTPHTNPNNASPFSTKNSFNGSSNLAKSTTGSRRITRFSSSLDRFRNASARGSKKELSLVVKELGDFPLTPIRDEEMKLIVGNENDIEAECGESSMRFDKRVTRSQSRLMGMNVDVGKIVEGKRIGCSSIKCSTRGVNSKRVCSSMQSLVIREDGDVGRISCSEEKGTRIDSCKGIVGRRGSRKGRQNNAAGYSRKDSKVGDSCKGIVPFSDRRMTRCDTKNSGEIGGNCSTLVVQKAVSVNPNNEKRRSKRVIEGKGKAMRDLVTKEIESEDCVELEVAKVRKETCEALAISNVVGSDEKKEHVSRKDNQVIGVKRKRNQIGVQGINHGWTKEQEVALHKAYFTAKPSPHFWKKVARLVPGKSAQECFNKVHSDSQTPVCSKPASRTRLQKSPSGILVSGIQLFKSAEKSKSKQTCKTKSKGKSQVARKTVRHLLQKYSHLNQKDEADLFSVLEPSVIPSVEAYQVTPKNLLKSPESARKSYDRSSSASMKRLSRFSNKGESPLMSPPVLKKVKNMALHEKYIDLLHVREQKRKVAFSRCRKSAQNQKGKETNSVQMKDKIRAAKNALVSDAKDVIDKFRDSQANIMEAFSESEEFDGSDDDEDEA